MTTQKIDVLAVMSYCSESLNEHGSGFAYDLDEARAVVAELIGAARDVIENEHEPRFIYGAINSLRKSIARIGGAA